MAGLSMSVENKAAEVAALTRELAGYEHRASTATEDEVRLKWEERASQVREQLAARGSDARPPRERATKRAPRGVGEDAETR